MDSNQYYGLGYRFGSANSLPVVEITLHHKAENGELRSLPFWFPKLPARSAEELGENEFVEWHPGSMIEIRGTKAYGK